jgi:ABC-type transport system involved in multi-copper enzyme maturation permease subunit
MDSQSTPVVIPPNPPRRWKLFARAENPVIQKELRGRMRKRQAVVMLTVYLSLLSLVIGVMYYSLSTTVSYYTRWDPQYRQTVGKTIFYSMVLMELFMISLLSPSVTASSITSERERQTFDILRITSLPTRSLVLGKLASALAYMLLLIVTAVPIESIAFLLGGVALEEILVSSLMLVVTAIFYCTLGLFFSSFMKRTSGASTASYVTIVLSYVFLGVAAIVSALYSSSMYGPTYTVKPWIAVLAVIMWLLLSTNPLVSAIVSEINLVDNQTLWTMELTLSGNNNIILPAPWIIYTAVYILLSILMIALSIRFVNRPDK